MVKLSGALVVPLAAAFASFSFDAKAIEPLTIAAGAQLAGAVLSAGSPGNKVSAAMMSAQLDMLVALHQRLDKLEESVSLALKLISELPNRIDEVEKQNLNLEKSEDVLGLTKSISDEIELSQNKKGKALEEHLNKVNDYYSQLVVKRNTLFRRSDHVAPTIIQSYAVELNALDFIHAQNDRIEQAKSLYKKRLSAMLDARRAGSLAWTYVTVKRIQNEQEAGIAKALGLSANRLRADLVQPYVFTLEKVEETWEGCYPRYLNQADRPKNMVICPKTVSKYTNFTYIRSMAIKIIDAPLDIFSIDYQYRDAVIKNDKVPAVKPTRVNENNKQKTLN
jgi:hypothetical protein